MHSPNQRITSWLWLIAAGASMMALCLPLTLFAVQQQAGMYSIVSKHSERCLDVTGWSRENGANIQQYTCHGGENQLFRLQPTSPDYFRLIAWHSQKCLDIAGRSDADYANVQQYDCHGGDNQQFRLERMDDGSYLLRPKQSNKCLDVTGWRTDNGANIQQYTCHGGDNQRWRLNPGRPRR